MNKLSLNAFSLKIIAIVTMGMQHTIRTLWEFIPLGVLLPMYIVRGITFPIMAFFVVEGFKRTKSVKKYILRLLIFAIIAQVPYLMAFEVFILNIIFAILLGLLGLVLYDNVYVKNQRHGQFGLAFAMLLLGSAAIVEGGFFGVLLIFFMYIINDERKRIVLPLALWGAFEFISMVLLQATVMSNPDAIAGMMRFMGLELELMQHFYVFSIGPFIAIPLLLAYNGEKGRSAKYLFYFFYPLHLLILALIAHNLGITDSLLWF